MDALDFSNLTDDQVVTLARAVAAEFRRRGGACQAAAEAAVLDEAEKARIAMEAASREARKRAEAEAKRIATEAAARVQHEVAADGAERLRAIAREARSLFGSDQSEFTISRWEKPGDRRIYIGGGYGSNWAEYHHDGSARTAPGTLVAIDAAVKPLAAHLGCTATAARAKIAAFCRGLIEGGFSGKLEVNASNAPCDPAAVKTTYALSWTVPAHQGRPAKTLYAGDKGSPLSGRYVVTRANAVVWSTPEAARAAIAEFACSLLDDQTGVEVVPCTTRVAFAPRAAQEAARA